MTKQLITLVGVLVSVIVIAAAVAVGVVPLVAGAFAADRDRQDVASTNQSYEALISSLEEDKKRLPEIEDGVAKLRTQIPEAALLNSAFELISDAEASSGVIVEEATRAELVPYAARTGNGDDPAAAPPTATPAPTDGSSTTGEAAIDPSAPIDAANDAAADADQNASTTDEVGGAPTTTPDSAGVSIGRQQVAIEIRVSAPDVESAFAFLDGLRAGPRALAIDTAKLVAANESFTLTVTALAFLQPAGS